MDSFHTPVLIEEVIKELEIRKNGLYIDATIGGGGHTERIITAGGRVLGIDQDENAILHIKKKFEPEIEKGQLILSQGNFSDIENIAKSNSFEKVDGILFDLGVSSFQLERSYSGFSFRREEKLDMRMSLSTSLTAREIVNTWPEEDLYELFAKYGEERRAREVAQEIVHKRAEKEIETTTELANIISKVVKPDGKTPVRQAQGRHPATKIFQALRIVVNDEIGNLKKGIEYGFKLLGSGGRFEIISFHSLEDRVVKLYFLRLEQEGKVRILNKKPIVASREEIIKNRRCRSAKLRIIVRLG